MIELALSVFFKAQGLMFRLDDTPCTLPVIVENLDPESVKLMKSGMVYPNEKQFKMCWGRTQDGFLFIDEDGMGGEVGSRQIKVSAGV